MSLCIEGSAGDAASGNPYCCSSCPGGCCCGTPRAHSLDYCSSRRRETPIPLTISPLAKNNLALFVSTNRAKGKRVKVKRVIFSPGDAASGNPHRCPRSQGGRRRCGTPRAHSLDHCTSRRRETLSPLGRPQMDWPSLPRYFLACR